MALYTRSSTGNLKFKDTGVTTTVSLFHGGSLGSLSLAETALGGDGGIVYYVPPKKITEVTSSGKLLFYPEPKTRNALGATALGEIPLAGEVDFISRVNGVKGFVTSANQTAGNMVLTGGLDQTYKRYNVTTSGQLRLTGAIVQNSIRTKPSAGQLILTATTVQRSLQLEQTSGNLVLTGTTVSLIIPKEPTAGNLTISGTDFVQRVWNKTTSGQLNLTGSIVQQSLRNASTSRTLLFSTYWYDTTHTGGLSSDPLAGAALGAGTESAIGAIKTTKYSFYGDNTSSGNLVVTDTGELVRAVSDSGTLAGSALAASPLGGDQDTLRRSSTYDTRLNENTTGNLITTGTSAYGYNILSSGNLVTTGNEAFAIKSVTVDSAGNIVTTGAIVQSSLRNEDTFGNIAFSNTGENPLGSGSSLAASALADLPLAGSVDYVTGSTRFGQTQNIDSIGNIWLNGTDVSVRTLDFLTSGNIVLSGSTVFEKTLDFTSGSNLIISGTYLTERTYVQVTLGNLAVSENAATPLSSAGSIAGSALGELPYAGGNDYVRTRFNQLQNPTSDGNITLSATSVPSSTLLRSSDGNLTLSITAATSSILIRTTNGNLLVSGTTVQNSTTDHLTFGNLTVSGTTDQNSTQSKDSITGNLVITGSSEYNALRLIDSAGQVTLNGVDTAVVYQIEPTAGNLVITSSDTIETIQIESSSGDLKITGASEYLIIAEGKTQYDKSSSGSLHISTTDTYESTLNKSTSGNLVISTSDTVERTVAFDTAGTLVLTANSTTETTSNEVSSGQLVLAANSVVEITSIENSAGQLVLTANSTTETTSVETSTGELALTATSQIEITVNEDSAGNLVLNGSSTVATNDNALYEEESSGNLRVTGSTTVVRTLSNFSSGNLELSGTDTVAKGYGTSSDGEIKFVSLSEFNSTQNESTAGNVKLTGTSEYDFRVSVRTVTSSGDLLVAGTANVSVIIVAKKQPSGGGGSGAYWGAYGAPFLVPLNRDWWPFRRKDKIEISTRIGDNLAWDRQEYDISQMQHDVKVAATHPLARQNYTTSINWLNPVEKEKPIVTTGQIHSVESTSDPIIIGEFIKKERAYNSIEFVKNTYNVRASLPEQKDYNIKVDFKIKE